MPYDHVPREIKTASTTPASPIDPAAIEMEPIAAVKPLVETEYQV